MTEIFENNLVKIKTKIRKLLALSKSDNENEALTALKKANDLIIQYELDKDSLLFESVQVKSTKTFIPYRTIIANAVSWLYGCYSYRDGIRGTFVFNGESLDSFLAGEMYSYLINTINRCVKKTVRKQAKRNYRLSFRHGMANRIYYRIMELGKSCSWAPYRENKIKEAKNFVERTTPLEEVKRKKVRLNRSAVSKGILYGDGVSLSRQAGYAPVNQIAAPHT